MKTKFLILTTEGGQFFNPFIGTQIAVDDLRKKAEDYTAGQFDVVAIPLATALAAPKLLAACKDVVSQRDRTIGPDNIVVFNSTVEKCEAAVLEATEGGTTTVAASPQQQNSPAESAPQTSPFTVCAYCAAGEPFPVLVGFIGDVSVAMATRRGENLYRTLNDYAKKNGVKWLYGQQPQPLY